MPWHRTGIGQKQRLRDWMESRRNRAGPSRRERNQVEKPSWKKAMRKCPRKTGKRHRKRRLGPWKTEKRQGILKKKKARNSSQRQRGKKKQCLTSS